MIETTSYQEPAFSVSSDCENIAIEAQAEVENWIEGCR